MPRKRSRSSASSTSTQQLPRPGSPSIHLPKKKVSSSPYGLPWRHLRSLSSPVHIQRRLKSPLTFGESSPKRRKIENWLEEKDVNSTTRKPKPSLEGPTINFPYRQVKLTAEALAPLSAESSGESCAETSITPSTTQGTMDATIDKSPSEKQAVVSTRDPRYESCLRDRGIFVEKNGAPKPGNLDDIHRMLNTRRESPEPTDYVAESFRQIARKCGNEGGAMQALVTELIGLKLSKYWKSTEDALPVNQQWSRKTSLEGGLNSAISPPQPDQAFGFTEDLFPYRHAKAHLDTAMLPNAFVVWPYMTLETKGTVSSVDVFNLQNANNAAVMLHNMLQLKRALKKEDEFLGKIQVMSFNITPIVISLSGHWAIRNSAGKLEYHSVCLGDESTRELSGASYKKSYQKIMNAMEYMRRKTLNWVKEDMMALEKKLVDEWIEREKTEKTLEEELRKSRRQQKSRVSSTSKRSGNGRITKRDNRGSSRRTSIHLDTHVSDDLERKTYIQRIASDRAGGPFRSR